MGGRGREKKQRKKITIIIRVCKNYLCRGKFHIVEHKAELQVPRYLQGDQNTQFFRQFLVPYKREYHKTFYSFES